jgi:hypothetical protein
MTTERNDPDERQARLDAMLEEFRAAQQRRLVKLGIALWSKRAAAEQALLPPVLTPEKSH